MFKTICIILSLTLCISVVAFAGDNDQEKPDAIPNFTDTQDINGNGETVNLGADKDAADFTPTERTVIILDAIKSNRQVMNPANGHPNN
jgi:hypothetical protein